jgi:hypothetical protein
MGACSSDFTGAGCGSTGPCDAEGCNTISDDEDSESDRGEMKAISDEMKFLSFPSSDRSFVDETASESSCVSSIASRQRRRFRSKERRPPPPPPLPPRPLTSAQSRRRFVSDTADEAGCVAPQGCLYVAESVIHKRPPTPG